MTEETIVEEVAVSQLPKGKERFSLYLRAPNWITKRDTSAKKIKNLDARITEVRFPRQKSAHFCYIDFSSAENRDQALKELQKLPEDQKIVVSKVTKDKPQQLEKRIEKVKKGREAKREMTTLLKGIERQEKKDAKAKRNSDLTSKVAATNVPRDTSIDELKNEFPNAINITLDYPEAKNQRGKALLTFATPGDALNESKRSVTLNDSELKLRIVLNKHGELTKAQLRRGRNKAAGRRKKDKKPAAGKTAAKKTQKGAVKKAQETGESKTAQKHKLPKDTGAPTNAKKAKKAETPAKSPKATKAKSPKSKKGKAAASGSDEIKIYN